jgi:DNA-binding winged helix-turn-helix (wHTH) protein
VRDNAVVELTPKLLDLLLHLLDHSGALVTKEQLLAFLRVSENALRTAAARALYRVS